MSIITLLGASSSDQTTLQGTDGADLFTVESDNIFVEALKGNDTVSGTRTIKNISVDTGADNDSLNFMAGLSTSALVLGVGNDTVNIQSFSGSIHSGAGADTLTSGSNYTITNAIIRGDGGSDDFNLGKLTNTIINSNADDDNINVEGSTTTAEDVFRRRKFNELERDCERTKRRGATLRGAQDSWDHTPAARSTDHQEALLDPPGGHD